MEEQKIIETSQPIPCKCFRVSNLLLEADPQLETLKEQVTEAVKSI